jgi:hypothetical protein
LNADRRLLQTIPGVGPLASSYLLCLLRGKLFKNAHAAAAFCGVVPLHRHSGTDDATRGRIAWECNRLFRANLYLPAINMRLYDPRMRGVYERLLVRGNTPRQATVAVVRRLIHIAYGVLKNQKEYSPDALAGKLILPNTDREKAGTRSEGEASSPCKQSKAGAPWSADDVRVLREHVADKSFKEIAQILGRTPSAVRTRACAEGLTHKAACPAGPRDP